MNDIKKYLKPGVTVKIKSSATDARIYTYHIRAVVDNDWIVYRRADKRFGWRYFIEDIGWFELVHENGRMLYPVIEHNLKE